MTGWMLLLMFTSLRLAAGQDTWRVQGDEEPKHGLESLEWGDRLNGTWLQLPPTAASHVHRRFILLGAFKANRPYQRCLAPGAKSGHCRHLQYCVLEDFRADFPRFLDYLCIIERSFVGVCCPDVGSPGGIFGLFNHGGAQPSTTDSSGSSGPPISVPSSPTLTRPETRGCGVSTVSGSRIVGGRPAQPKEWPWVAALLRDGGRQYCGGVLISDRHVLTAAHCIDRLQARDITVRLGEYDFDMEDETRHRDFKVSEIRKHADYMRGTYENDIAILKMARPTAFNSYIWPVCLPTNGDTYEDKTAIVIGWGTVSYGGPSSSVLMEVAIPVWKQSDCVTKFTQPILPKMMCAGAVEGGKDSCQGDSGGPLLYQLENGRWTTIGVVSWGIRCGEREKPGIYTRVNRYRDWIIANSIF